MTELLTFSADQVAPDRTAVLANQGIPAGRPVPEGTEELYTQAVHLLAEVAARDQAMHSLQAEVVAWERAVLSLQA